MCPQNDFERGKTDTFYLDAPDIGRFRSLLMAHDNSGFGAAWKLAKVVIVNTNTGENATFPCNRYGCVGVWAVVFETLCFATTPPSPPALNSPLPALYFSFPRPLSVLAVILTHQSPLDPSPTTPLPPCPSRPSGDPCTLVPRANPQPCPTHPPGGWTRKTVCRCC